MPADNTVKKVGALTNDARASLDDLLCFEKLQTNQWYLRISLSGHAESWELLTNDPTKDSSEIIKERIARSGKPASDLVLAFAGDVDHRGKKQLMARLQYFRAGYKTGLLFGSHLSTNSANHKLQADGAFLIFGGCQNLWI